MRGLQEYRSKCKKIKHVARHILVPDKAWGQGAWKRQNSRGQGVEGSK